MCNCFRLIVCGRNPAKTLGSSLFSFRSILTKSLFIKENKNTATFSSRQSIGLTKVGSWVAKNTCFCLDCLSKKRSSACFPEGFKPSSGSSMSRIPVLLSVSILLQGKSVILLQTPALQSLCQTFSYPSSLQSRLWRISIILGSIMSLRKLINVLCCEAGRFFELMYSGMLFPL